MLKQAGVLSMLLFLGSYSAHGADVALWRFDADGKAAGQTADTVNDSIGSYTGSASGSPVYDAGVPHVWPGRTGEAAAPNYSLHGAPSGALNNGLSVLMSTASSQYISVPDSTALRMGASASFTVEAWVKLTTLPGESSGRQWLVHKSAGTDATTDYGVLVGGADLATDSQYRIWANELDPSGGAKTSWTGRELVLVFGNGTAMQAAVSKLEIADSEWHHVMVSYNGAKNEVVFMRDFVPELLTLGEVTPGNVAGTGSLIIGGRSTGSGADQTFDGKMDEVRIARHSLPGSPDSVGIPANLLAAIPTWWWNTEGGLLCGSFNPLGVRTLRFRADRWSDDTNLGTYWDVQSLGGGEDAFKINEILYGYGSSKNYIMFDPTTGGARTDIAPDNRSKGATFAMRFRINSYSKFGTNQRCLKWVRMDFNLKDGVGSKLFWEIGYDDLLANTGIALYREEENPRNKRSTLTPGTWYVLHGVAYVDGGLPHMKTWLDGTQIDDWTAASRTPDSSVPYIGTNDNNSTENQGIDFDIDYARFSPDAAWAPDGTLLTPEGDLGLCSNGIDDDGVNGADCVDPSCASASACKCYPHVLWADQDDDLDVDMDDFGVFQACYTGSGTFGLVQPCSCLDRDDDKDVDADDFNAFLVCASGPGIASPGCP